MPERSDFWSRRRRAVAREETRATEEGATAEADAAAEALSEKSDAELLAHFGLPDPETLTPADAARFMAREIPARLRRRAIRHLFRSHPHLSLPDGLQDYDQDYTDAAVNVRPDPTAWVDLRGTAAQLAKRATEEAPRELAPEETAEVVAAEPAPEVAPDPGFAPVPDDEDPDAPPHPRRMTFRFEEDAH